MLQLEKVIKPVQTLGISVNLFQSTHGASTILPSKWSLSSGKAKLSETFVTPTKHTEHDVHMLPAVLQNSQ